MFKRFYPDKYMESTYAIDFEKLYREGIKGLIFDVDNTLVPHGAASDARAIALFQPLHTIGFKLMLLSINN